MTVGGIRRRWLTLSGNTRGAVWVLLGSAGFSVMSMLVKMLGQDWDSFQIAFFRCVVGLAVLAPIAIAAGPSILRTRVPHLHLMRAGAGIGAMLCGFYAVTHLPLATATAITFSKALFMILVAVIVLREVVRWRRWTATIVGFAGVVIMVRPGNMAFEFAMFVALAQAMLIALAVATVKKLPSDEPNTTLLIYFALISTTVTGLIVPFVWQPASWHQLGLAAMMGIVGVASQAAMIRGFRAGEASALGPLDYSRLVFATILGFLAFGELPDEWTILGAGIIIASTIYIARREAKLGSPKAGPTTD